MASFDKRASVVSVSFKHERRARALGKKRQKSRSGGGGGGGGGAGKERKHLPLSTDLLPSAVRQRTGGNDELPLVNSLSIKHIDQNDIQFPFIKDQNMAKSEENSWRVSFRSAETEAKGCF